jgi:hypothetical protein
VLPQERVKNEKDKTQNKLKDPGLSLLSPVTEDADSAAGNNNGTPGTQATDINRFSVRKSGGLAGTAANSPTPSAQTSLGTMQLYLFVEMVSCFRLPEYEDPDHQTLKERLENRKDRQQQLLHNRRSQPRQDAAAASASASTSVSATAAASPGVASSWSFFQRSSAQPNAGAGVINSSDPGLSPVRSPTPGELRDSRDARGRSRDRDAGDDRSTAGRSKSRDVTKRDRTAVENVEMCAAWAMIPISELIGTAGSKPFGMSGGTPFMNVNIRGVDIVNRSGAWQALKRNMGYQVKPKLSVLVTPPTAFNVANPPAGATGPAGRPTSMSFRSPGRPPLMSFSPVPPNAIDKPAKDDDTKLISLLPPQLVLPTNGITLVGIYRELLKENMRLKLDPCDRVLPQTNVTMQQDVILGSFPKILADPATASVLMKLWATVVPDTLTTKKLASITVADVSTKRVKDAFHDVVLKLYRTLHCVDAQPDKLNPFETAETLYKREELIRRLCGLVPTAAGAVAGAGPGAAGGSAAAPGATAAPTMGQPGTAAANATKTDDFDITQVLYEPFNCRELHWSRNRSMN